MSLLPYLLEDFRPFRPSRILDQHFGVGLDPEDLLLPFNVPQWNAGPLRRLPGSYYRPWRTSAAERDSGSVVLSDKDKFQVNLDVQHFAPEEISVKVTGNTVTIEGKHEEKQDEHGFISRQFVRKYILPEGLNVEKLSSNLSSDGVLSITAPKLQTEETADRAIPIQQTGVPSKSIESKKEKDTPMEG